MKAFRTISAVLLAILVLVSSTSFMVGMHICMGEVQNVALFAHADSCQKEKSLPPCHLKPACCDDQVFFHEGTDFKAVIEHIHFEAPGLVEMEQALILISEIIPTALPRTEYHNYDPPLRSRDITVDHQVFLI